MTVKHSLFPESELVQLKLNIETSVGDSTPTQVEYGVRLPLIEVGVSPLDETWYTDLKNMTADEGGGIVSKAKPDANDLRRLIGYTMITFMSVFIFFPVLWFVHLFSQNPGLYSRWVICSAFLVIFNILFYYWKYPIDWFRNLLALVVINLLILIFEYFWLMQSIS